jgi:hypothetical protein
MKTIRIATAAFIAASSLSSAAHAQDAPSEVRVSWGVMAGGEGLAKSFHGSQLQNPEVAGLLVQFPLSPHRLAIRVDLMLHYAQEDCGRDVICGPLYMGSGSVALVARLNDPATRWSPYALAGAGYYLEPLTAGDRPPGNVGLQAGFGFEVRPSVHTFFVELRYLNMSPGALVPVTIGMRY